MKQIRKKRSPKGISSCIYTCIGIDLDIYDWYCEQPNRTRLVNDLLRTRKNEEEKKQLLLDFKNPCSLMTDKRECYTYEINGGTCEKCVIFLKEKALGKT